MTLPSPTWARISSILVLRNSAMVQSPGEPADVAHEIGDQPPAVGRVDHFGVELRAVELALLVGDHREGRAVADRDDLETGGEAGDLVAVAHPHLVPLADVPEAVEQRAFLGHGEEGAAEFAAFARLVPGAHFAAELVAHHLLAVADAQDRHAGLEQDFGARGAAFIGHSGGRAGQDDAFGLQAGGMRPRPARTGRFRNRRRPRAPVAR